MNPHTLRSTRFAAGWVLVLLAGLWSGVGAAAQIESSSKSAYDPRAAYKKKIPGSSSTIQGSRPRSYIQPKKMTYQEHMASLGSHRFRNDKSSFSQKAAAKSSVISRRSPSSAQPPKSRLNIHKSIGHKNPGLAAADPLSNSELNFLDKLTQTVRANDPAAGSRLSQITAGQKRGQTLSKDDYDFLNAVAKKVKDGQATFRLHSIAEKRRDKGK